MARDLNEVVLARLGGLIGVAAFGSVFLIGALFVSPLGGVRMLSNLGGAPGLLIIVGCASALVRLAIMGPSRLN